MIWRLRYCNKKGVEARVDIIKGDRTPVEAVQGSANPFTISYRLDKNDKSGHIMTSSADIEIFETETFNIDDLKTSNETELKVEYFEGNILTWSGFILPDFFSREIGSPNIVRMTASDRLTALKGVTLSDLPIRVSLRDLIELSLAQTGLSLALVAQIQINQGSVNILDSEILSQRLTDTRGRSISCYDILMSIMVATNSTIRQREGQWVVYNKLEHELRTPTIFFDKVERGAIRTIQPVASTVGIYHEHGGGLTYPTNYNFSDGLNGWTAVNGFVASINDKRVEEFELIGNSLHPIYGDTTNVNYLVNKNEQYMTNASAPYIVSEQITIPYPVNSEVAISVDMNAISAVYPPESLTVSRVDFVVVATKGSDILFLNKEGVFTEADNNLPVISSHMHRMVFSSTTPYIAISRQMTVNGVLTVEDGFVSDYTISVRIYGSGTAYTALINSVAVRFNKTKDTPKGTIFKTTQGSNFTKLHDVETAILGDYITSGLNGYFYDYPVDDTSNLYLPSGTLSSPTWITAFDTTERPLLHHISRQKSRLFSVAHDILKANINVESFDPLAVFQDCKGGKYVVVSASFDFLRSEVDVELEQIAYDNTILKRDFIYSYFGEGENNIKSIGGIAGGGGGIGGGGMTSEQLEMLTNLASWWKLDEENDAIYSEKSVYSLKGVSALGLGPGGGGGGGDFDRLDAWADYDSSKSGWVLSALLGYDLHTRANALNSALTVHTGNSTIHITSGERTNWNDANSKKHTHGNKSVIDALTQGHINVLNKLSLDAQGNVKVDATLWATGGISALGLGDGGSGGGVDMLDSWANYTSAKANYYVPASLLVSFRNNTLDRLASLESGSATSIDTTGSGNAITSVSKSGNTLTFTKGSTFSLSTHTHTIAQITGLQGALDSKATQSDIDTAINNLEIGGRNLMPENTTFYTSRWARAGMYEYKAKSGGDTFPLFLIQDYAEVGKQYTLSFELKSTVDGAVFKNNTLYVNNALTVTHNSPELIKDKYVKVYGSFTYVEGGSYVHIYINGVTNADELYIRNWKLEKGNKPTDWTPAPEDQVSDWNESNASSFSFIKNKPTQLSQFTDNIGVGAHIANRANPHAVTTAQIGAVDLVSAQTVGGVKSFSDNIVVKRTLQDIGANTRMLSLSSNRIGNVCSVNLTMDKKDPDGYGLLFRVYKQNVGRIDALSINHDGNVGIGTTSPSQKLHVAGNILSTGNLTASAGVNTPKVIFAAAGWSLEQVGTELQIKHNGVIKQRMLSNGTILATGGITALST
jgi:hypothetical protein